MTKAEQRLKEIESSLCDGDCFCKNCNNLQMEKEGILLGMESMKEDNWEATQRGYNIQLKAQKLVFNGIVTDFMKRYRYAWETKNPLTAFEIEELLTIKIHPMYNELKLIERDLKSSLLKKLEEKKFCCKDNPYCDETPHQVVKWSDVEEVLR